MQLHRYSAKYYRHLLTPLALCFKNSCSFCVSFRLSIKSSTFWYIAFRLPNSFSALRRASFGGESICTFRCLYYNRD